LIAQLLYKFTDHLFVIIHYKKKHYSLFIKIEGVTLTTKNLRSTYLSAPTVGLTQAIQKIPQAQSKLSYCGIISNINAGQKYGLTHDETAAIRLYTDSCGVYRLANEALRTEKYANIQPWFEYLKLFHTGVMKLPAGKGPYCRGESGSYSESYQVGSVVTWVR
jgi:hypothetical protein